MPKRIQRKRIKGWRMPGGAAWAVESFIAGLTGRGQPFIAIGHEPDAEYGTPLDPGIRRAVIALRAGGIETFESCEGGDGHAYLEPTVRFHGERAEGFRAYSVAVANGLPVKALRRIWREIDGELSGPLWELTFAPTAALWGD